MSASSRSAELLVVGGGLIGAAAAALFARAGFAVLWLGAPAPDFRLRGPGPLAIAPAGRALLLRHGLWPTPALSEQPVQRMRIWDGSAALTFSAAELEVPALAYIVAGEALHAMLASVARTEAVCVGADSAEIAEIGLLGGGVELRLASGESIRARVLLLCDGASSPLSRQLGVAALERDYAAQALLLEVRGERPHQATAFQRFLPGGPLALLPLAHGASQVVWTLPEVEARRILRFSAPERLAAIEAASEGCLGALREATEPLALPLRMRLAERYAGDRFVLLGDAAHRVHPLAGQGANLGLLDLAWLLAALQWARRRGLDLGSPAVLERYARPRRSDATLAGLFFDGVERLFSTSRPWVVGGRRLGMWIADRWLPLKRFFAQQAMGWATWPSALAGEGNEG